VYIRNKKATKVQNQTSSSARSQVAFSSAYSTNKNSAQPIEDFYK
jgi:hypothetical protein